MTEHIHCYGDGRGRRRVFVNGNEVSRPIWADLKRGLVRYAPAPLRIKRNSDELYTRTLRGVVTVELI